MPRMGKTAEGKPVGLDVAVAEHVARILGRPIEFHWCASAECAWHCLPEAAVIVVIGQPQDSGPPREVAWSVPYAIAQFGLVVPRDFRASGSLADFRANASESLPAPSRSRKKTTSSSSSSRVKSFWRGFAAAALDAAFLDADFAAWYLHEHRQLGLRLLPDYVPRERWNMALAVRAKDTQLLVEINRALGQLAESGEIAADLRRGYGVPFHPPFSGIARAKRRVIPGTAFASAVS